MLGEKESKDSRHDTQGKITLKTYRKAGDNPYSGGLKTLNQHPNPLTEAQASTSVAADYKFSDGRQTSVPGNQPNRSSLVFKKQITKLHIVQHCTNISVIEKK